MRPESKVLNMRGVRVECRRHPLLWYGLHAKYDVHRFCQAVGIGWGHGADQYAVDVELDLAVGCTINTVRVIAARWIKVGNSTFVTDVLGGWRRATVKAMEIVGHFQTVVYRRRDCVYDVDFTSEALKPK